MSNSPRELWEASSALGEKSSSAPEAPAFPLALIGVSSGTQQLRQQIQRIAPYYRRALLTGERGTGKQQLARQLHHLSPMLKGPFVSAAASVLAEDNSPIEGARHGTLFLDDIGSLPLSMQDALVRRLLDLERRVRTRLAETRLVTASHTDLKTLTATGQFRLDLHTCVSVVELKLLPLRERLEDLPFLAEFCLRRTQTTDEEVPAFTQAARERLASYGWPGNLTEFEAVITEAAATAAIRGVRVIDVQHLPELNGKLDPSVQPSEPPPIARLDDVMRRHVVEVLSRCAGNKLKAAELLGISRSTLYRMLDGA